MDNKDIPRVRPGDLIVNEIAQCTFLITNCVGKKVELLMVDCKSKSSKTFQMSKNRFLEQLTGVRGTNELKYFPVKSSK